MNDASKPPSGLQNFFRADRIASLLGFIVLLLVWQYSGLPEFILPTPTAIATKFFTDATSGVLGPHLWITFIEVIIGFGCAGLFGVALGSAIALVPLVERMIYPYVIGLQTIPKVAIAPLFVIWFGFGIQSKIVTAGLIAFFPILVNVIAGLKAVDPRQLLLMRSLKASAWESFVKVRFPSMLPYFFAGLEIGIIFSIIGAIVGEFVGSSQGLGSLIVQRQSSIDVAGVFSVLIYLSLMGISLNYVLKLVSRHFMFWAAESKLK